MVAAETRFLWLTFQHRGRVLEIAALDIGQPLQVTQNCTTQFGYHSATFGDDHAPPAGYRFPLNVHASVLLATSLSPRTASELR